MLFLDCGFGSVELKISMSNFEDSTNFRILSFREKEIFVVESERGLCDFLLGIWNLLFMKQLEP